MRAHLLSFHNYHHDCHQQSWRNGADSDHFRAHFINRHGPQGPLHNNSRINTVISNNYYKTIKYFTNINIYITNQRLILSLILYAKPISIQRLYFKAGVLKISFQLCVLLFTKIYLRIISLVGMKGPHFIDKPINSKSVN